MDITTALPPPATMPVAHPISPLEPDRMVLVAITGLARSGKDTVAARMSDKHGFTRFAFADPLRDTLLAQDPVVGCACDGRPTRLSTVITALGWEGVKTTGWGPEVRNLLQGLGSAVRHHLSRSAFIDATAARISASGSRRVVIGDARYHDECDWVRDHGGIVVGVTRPGSGLPGGQGRHESELDRPRTDYTIDNTGTIADLHLQVDALIALLDRGPTTDSTIDKDRQ